MTRTRETGWTLLVTKHGETTSVPIGEWDAVLAAFERGAAFYRGAGLFGGVVCVKLGDVSYIKQVTPESIAANMADERLDKADLTS